MNFTVEIASVPDRDDAVAEIWHSNDMVAEVYHDEYGKLNIDIYPNKSSELWKFELSSWQSALAEAKSRLGL